MIHVFTTQRGQFNYINKDSNEMNNNYYCSVIASNLLTKVKKKKKKEFSRLNLKLKNYQSYIIWQ